MANLGRRFAATVSSFIVKRPPNDGINRSLAILRIAGNAALHSVLEAKVFRCTKVRPSGIVSKYTFITALNLSRICKAPLWIGALGGKQKRRWHPSHLKPKLDFALRHLRKVTSDASKRARFVFADQRIAVRMEASD